MFFVGDHFALSEHTLTQDSPTVSGACYFEPNPWGALVLARPGNDDRRTLRTVFAENLAQLLTKRGSNARKLALQLGMSPSAVGAWKKGLKDPTFENIDRVANALGIPPYMLFVDSKVDKAILMDGQTPQELIRQMAKMLLTQLGDEPEGKT